ncbi:hypothetical protein OG21DRAFT_1506277 [Imleria badia]|nr:hypothetical protein OG21DRAFT_1506277 [Imleria badia]
MTTRMLTVPRRRNVPKVSETTHDHHLSFLLTHFAIPEATRMPRSASPEEKETNDTYYSNIARAFA